MTKFTNNILFGGIILGVLSVALIFCGEFISPQWVVMVISLIILFTVPYIIGKSYKKAIPGEEPFSFGKAFQYVLFMVMISSVISAIGSYVYFETRDIHELVNKGVEQMQSMGLEVTQAQIDALYKSYENTLLLTAYSALGSLCSGVVIGLIVGALIKKSDREVIAE